MHVDNQLNLESRCSDGNAADRAVGAWGRGARLLVRRCLGLSRGLLAMVVLSQAEPVDGQEADSNSQGRYFAAGAVRRMEDFPAGSRLRSQLERLQPEARGRAIEWLKGFGFPAADVASLHADSQGGICYGCHFHGRPAAEDAAGGEAGVAGGTGGPVVAMAAVPVSPFPSSLVFQSRPGATNVIYVNFAGETVTGTQWNTELARSSIPALPFSTDSDHSTFSDEEQLAIKRVWQRMAEDFAPFNVNVTTQRPASFTSRTAMVVITRNTDANGAPHFASTAGGVAYVNVFGLSNFATYRPAWVYHNNLGNSESNIAEAASHEIGHNLGLSHDGTTSLEYYGGHGAGTSLVSWGPLMGTGYNRNVSQWSKGEYYQANNLEDDLAVIAGKLSYRADDHGGTPAAATALTLTGGTQISSTTPENDPTNSNPVNKGVLERNTDVDVFSFVTGSGNVRLDVNPWIQPVGTRGGNLHLRIELYNEAGNLLASHQPPDRTNAWIEANLAAGRYYLHVRNAGVGSPLSSSPTGYTSYGSIGQYFVSGTVQDASGLIEPPLAELQTTSPVNQTGQTSKPFTVTYADNVGINVSTLGTGDIRVTGPNGYNQLAGFVAVDLATNGTPRSATYSVTPPGGGAWLPSHNGTYQIEVLSGQVSDVEGAFVTARPLGSFEVSVPLVYYSANMDTNPGWDLQPQWEYGVPAYPANSNGPPAAFTGTQIIAYNLSGDYSNGLQQRNATTPVINTAGATSLTLRFMRWLRTRSQDNVSIEGSTDGQSWTLIWGETSAVGDTFWQAFQYPLPQNLVGSPTLRLRWTLTSNGRNTDVGWNIDDVQLLGSGTLDTVPPEAALSVANLTSGGSPSHACSVTYTDGTAVRLSSIDSGDLWVTGPNGYASAAGWVGSDREVDGSPVTASYSIPAPGGGTWSEVHNGSYTVSLREAAVQDTFNNSNAATVLGTFAVAIAPPPPGALRVEGADGLVSSGVAGGPFSPESIVYTLSNSGGQAINWTAAKSAPWVSLSATGGTLAAGATTSVTVSINNNAATLDAGSYTDVVNFTNTTNGTGNTARSVNLTVIAPGVLAVEGGAGLVSSGVAGGPFSPENIVYTLSNSGGQSVNWTAAKSAPWVSLSATGGTLAAGATTSVTVSINNNAATLEAGSYTDVVNFTNTTNGTGNTSRSVNLTVIAPGVLAVEGGGGLVSSGMAGGPFSPESIVYTLSNSGGQSVNWTAAKSAPWVSLSATGGTLAAGATTSVTVSINNNAATLDAGSYTDVVNFTNTTNGTGNTARDITLVVAEPPPLIVQAPGWTGSGAFQLLIRGRPGSLVTVEASPNLLNWEAIQQAVIGEGGTLILTDPGSVEVPARFYRVRQGSSP